MKKFVVVTGPGRSGTSLAMSLVCAAGFNRGKCLPPNKQKSLRHGYNEHPLTNTQGEDIERAIDELEAEGCNVVKLIHLHGQWIPRLKARGYDVKVIVTSRPESEIWASGREIYPDWKPQAIGAICGTASQILRETRGYLDDPNTSAYELPFHKVVEKDTELLLGLWTFLVEEDGVYHGGSSYALKKMEELIKPEVSKNIGKQ